MSWSMSFTNIASREELRTAAREHEQAEHIPGEIQNLIDKAIDQIPSLGDSKDAPATGYNLTTYGHIDTSELGGTSNFTISVSNNFVTSGRK